jgi:multimeric flavodoxin WrbA
MKSIGSNANSKGNASNNLKLLDFVLNGAETEGAETKL